MKPEREGGTNLRFAVLIALLVGGLIGGAVGWSLGKPDETDTANGLPRPGRPVEYTLTGRITAINADKTAFGFRADAGTNPPEPSGGFEIGYRMEGMRFIRMGAHVRLRFVAVAGAQDIVISASPVGAG
jgi:hypothetical protein